MGSTPDRDALEILYRERFGSFARIAESVTGDASSAHDAVQEGFARARRDGRHRVGNSARRACAAAAFDGGGWEMIETERRIRAEVARLLPPPASSADWQDVVARASVAVAVAVARPSHARRRSSIA